MYCANCGQKLPNGVAYCSSCGGAVALGEFPNTTGDAQPGVQATAGGAYASWEYARTVVKSDLAQVATDCYECLGFELTGAKSDEIRSSTTLSFRRSRKVRGKAQLVKLQRTMDDLISSIADMETEKTRKASARAIAVGILSALVLGVGMCCTMVWTHLMIPGIVVGVVGIAGCVGAWLLYRSTVASESKRIEPRIEAAHDSLATACEEAQAVLRSQATTQAQ